MAFPMLVQSIQRLRPCYQHVLAWRRFSQAAVCAGRRGLGDPQAIRSMDEPERPKIFFQEKEHPFHEEDRDDEELEGDNETLKFSWDNSKERIRRKQFARKQQIHSPVLMTWAAREQMKYLYRQDPLTWSPERLARAYPITVADARLLVTGHSSFLPNSKYIQRHDKRVEERWQALKKGRSAKGKEDLVTAEQRALFAEGKLSESQSRLNVTFPLPPTPVEAPKPPPPPPGPFSKLIQGYIEKKALEKSQKAAKSGVPAVTPAIDAHPANYRPLTMPVTYLPVHAAGMEISVVPDPEDQTPDIRMRYPARGPQPRDTRAIMHEQIKERIEARTSRQGAELGAAYSQWFGSFDAANLAPSERTVLKERQIENIVTAPEEENRPGSHKLAKYAAKPWEARKKTLPRTNAEISDRITIPEGLRKEHTIYRQGDAFYDSEGDFLYRIPG